MPRNVYSEINLHITWHTKLNDPVVAGTIEQRLHHFLEHTVRDTKGVIFHAVDGTEDHIHLVATVPPSLLVSDWIGKLKGGSSFYVNHEIANQKLLDWQEGYGVVSFGTKDLPWVIRYVKNQRASRSRDSARATRASGERRIGRPLKRPVMNCFVALTSRTTAGLLALRASRMNAADGSSLASFALLVIGLLFAAFVGVLFYLFGVMVSAQGQIPKASLDGAVNSSRFLTNEHRAKIMSLR